MEKGQLSRLPSEAPPRSLLSRCLARSRLPALRSTMDRATRMEPRVVPGTQPARSQGLGPEFIRKHVIPVTEGGGVRFSPVQPR